MSKTYRPCNPNQQYLMPPSLRDWLPEEHLAYFVSDTIDEMDLSEIDGWYERGLGYGAAAMNGQAQEHTVSGQRIPALALAA